MGVDVAASSAPPSCRSAIIVVGLSLLLLLAVFRSLVVPVKAAVGFLLRSAASFGAVVARLPMGLAGQAIGVSKTGPIACFLPIILMAVLFGLAMDYEVFLVSRIERATPASATRGRRSWPAVAPRRESSSRQPSS